MIMMKRCVRTANAGESCELHERFGSACVVGDYDAYANANLTMDLLMSNERCVVVGRKKSLTVFCSSSFDVLLLGDTSCSAARHERRFVPV